MEQTVSQKKQMDRHEKRNLKKAIIFACVIIVALFAAYFALCAVAAAEDNIYPKIMVASTSVGGMTCEEAEAAIRENMGNSVPSSTQGVVFSAENEEGKTAVVRVPLSSTEVDCVASAAKAWSVGNSRSFLARGGIFLKCLLFGQTLTPTYGDSSQLEELLDEMDTQVGQEAVSSSYQVSGTELVLTKGVPGNKLKRDDLREEIFRMMGSEQTVDVTSAQPQFTVKLEQTLPENLDLQKIYSEVCQEVQDAKFDKAARIFQTDSQGISFDTEKAQSVFDGLDWGESGKVPLIITKPKTTVADLEPYLYQDLLGSCTTSIAGSANRLSNITLAASFFNGTVLQPGEEFSYNGTVGQRTKAQGFLDAPAYVSGQTVQETGGGVCQGSSTIYLAALRSNLEITERYNHGYVVHYVPDGMDATVYYGAKDFKFKNNTAFPIKIVGSVSGRTLTVNIYGTKTDDIIVKMTNETTGTSTYKTVYKVDNSVPAGTTKVSVTPYAGCTVKTYRNLYDGSGKLLRTSLEGTSVYKSRDKVILVNAADAYKYGISGYSAPSVDTTENSEDAPE